MKVFITIFFCFICYMSLLLPSHFNIFRENVKMTWLILVLFGLLLLLLLTVGSFFKLKVNISFCEIQPAIIVFVFLFICVGFLQYIEFLDKNSGFPVDGNFDNPAAYSSALSVAFPVVINYTMKKGYKLLGVLIVAMLILGIVLSSSRAGIVTIITTTSILSYWHFSFMRKKFVFIITLILFLVVILSSFIKQDSSLGRILIWRVSLEMIKEKPLLGHGAHGFDRKYMIYQKEYLNKITDLKYRQLADNIHKPLNEFVGIAVDFGLIGLFIVIIVSVFLIYKSIKTGDLYSEPWALCFISILIFSLFSYPLSYPFTWIILIVYFYNTLSKCNLKKITKFRNAYFIFIFSLLFILFKINLKDLRLQVSFMKLKHNFFDRDYANNLEILKENELFVYEYSLFLSKNQQYYESNNNAIFLYNKWVDYDLALLIAFNALKIHDTKKAEYYFREAMEMCPSRFLPLYGLHCTYLKEKRFYLAKNVAMAIIDKPIKISSNTVNKIKSHMLNYVRLLK